MNPAPFAGDPRSVRLVTGSPGSGKTAGARQSAIAVPGLYAVALPSIALIAEQHAAFAADAPTLRVFEAHYKASKRPVERQFSDIVKLIEGEGIDHAVVLLSHAALLARDLGPLVGWHVCIDEAPDAVKCGRIGLTADTCAWFAQTFDLRPCGHGGWSEMVPIGVRPSWAKLKRDSLLSGVTDLLEATKAAGPVFVNLTEWDGADGFDWCAVWTPLALSQFASVTLIGASYLTSVGGLICQRWMGDVLQFHEDRLPAERTGQPAIRIHWFTERRAGKSEWATKPGRGALRDIASYLRRVEPNLGFWSANTNAQEFLDAYMPGQHERPKVAGLNRYRNLRSCAMFYGSGQTPGDTVLVDVFGFSAETIRRAREDEDIFQFAMRGAIRNADDVGQYDVYLYSRWQAERLIDRLRTDGFSDLETVAHPDVIRWDSQVPDRGDTQLTKTASEKRARKTELQRERRWIAAGEMGRRPGVPGRPARPP